MRADVSRLGSQIGRLRESLIEISKKREKESQRVAAEIREILTPLFQEWGLKLSIWADTDPDIDYSSHTIYHPLPHGPQEGRRWVRDCVDAQEKYLLFCIFPELNEYLQEFQWVLTDDIHIDGISGGTDWEWLGHPWKGDLISLPHPLPRVEDRWNYYGPMTPRLREDILKSTYPENALKCIPFYTKGSKLPLKRVPPDSWICD